MIGRIVLVRTRSGGAVVPAPVDYVVWTEAVKRFAEHARPSAKRREILVTGSASQAARDGLVAARWTLREHSER